ncbi:Fasciclin-domain-containing protein [Thozetella sp. PMI_491]|nr:Fasciclin-domain-containing protein [Thozetella sp. PMI_491]
MLRRHLQDLSLPASVLGLLTALLVGTPRGVQGAVAATGDLGTVLASKSNLSTYTDLVKTYPDILLQLPNYAGIVAPNNEAFTKLGSAWDPKNKSMVTDILEYHMLQGTVATGAIMEGPSYFYPTFLTDPLYTNVTGGQNMIVNKQGGDIVVFTSGLGSRSTLVEADITFSGGLIQMVDSLMVPPARLEPTARDAYKDLTAFLAALYATDLVDYFANTPNVTIFAPRNAAFQLVSGALEALSKEDLAAVMRYHILPGVVIPSPKFQNGTNFTAGTLASSKIHITRSGNNMYVDRAQLLQPDILIANGVVHIIDGVLNPNAATATPDISVGTQAPVFTLTGDTSVGTEQPVPFTSYLPCTTDCPPPPGSNSTEAPAHGPATTTSGGAKSSTSSGAAAAGPRCTGMPMVAGMGAGLLGLGLGVAGMV